MSTEMASTGAEALSAPQTPARAEFAMQSAVEVWRQVCEILSRHLGAETIELWLKPIEPSTCFDLDGGKAELLVQAPSRIFCDWIKTRCQTLIEDVLTQIAGKPAALKITIAAIESEDLNLGSAATAPATPVAAAEKAPAFMLKPEGNFGLEQFNSKYTFENFIEGQANRFAKAAAEGIAKEPGVRFNPLFIYGGVGLGKTHLMHALGTALVRNHPRSRVLYISSEKFINEFINSLRFDRPSAFREKYRSLDCLLIDDIQFLIGKDRSEEEFFFTFNTLFDSRKQIVISSDRPPKELGSLQDRLISRFEWGVVADIQPPDLETRIAILRTKAASDGIYVPEDVIQFIASVVKSNIRELEGALIRTAARASLTHQPLTVDFARSALKDTLRKEAEETPVTLEWIQEVVARHFNLDVKEIKSRKRTDAIAWPRQIAMYLARTLTELSTTEIGEQFGGKDHTTVIHACEKVKLKLAESPFISSLINKITQEIKPGPQ